VVRRPGLRLAQPYPVARLCAVFDSAGGGAAVSDMVNHPEHYKAAGIEVLDVIEAFGLGFRLGNATKYILRAGRKGAARTDLEKARWYIDRELAALEKAP
jgi:hypothetical protein